MSSVRQEQQVIKTFPSSREKLISVFERGSLTMGTGIGLLSQASHTEDREAPGVKATFVIPSIQALITILLSNYVGSTWSGLACCHQPCQLKLLTSFRHHQARRT